MSEVNISQRDGNLNVTGHRAKGLILSNTIQLLFITIRLKYCIPIYWPIDDCLMG